MHWFAAAHKREARTKNISAKAFFMAQDSTNNDRHQSGWVVVALAMSQVVEVRFLSGDELCCITTATRICVVNI